MTERADRRRMDGMDGMNGRTGWVGMDEFNSHTEYIYLYLPLASYLSSEMTGQISVHLMGPRTCLNRITERTDFCTQAGGLVYLVRFRVLNDDHHLSGSCSMIAVVWQSKQSVTYSTTVRPSRTSQRPHLVSKSTVHAALPFPTTPSQCL